MSDNSDMMKLYSQRILALTTAIPHLGLLANPDAQVKERAPLCGSTVTVSLNVENGVISALGLDVKACALGQASAAVIGQSAIGRSLDDITTLRDQLSNMLKNSGPVPDAPFEELEVLQPASEYKNRHASILLMAEATLKALQSV